MKRILIENDHFLKIVPVMLDPRTSEDHVRAVADFFAHDVPDFLGWCEQLRGEIGKVSAPQLRRALRLCLRADREIKGAGAKNPAHAFERLVHGIARSAGGAS